MMDLRELREFFIDTFKYILVIIFVIFIVVYVCTLQQVIGPSMEPNLNDGDILLLNKLVYKFKKPQRFDVVIFKHDEKQYLIKRVIGLPGETVTYKNNSLYINGVQHEEDFISNVTTLDFSSENLGHNTIPENMYLVIGDNRSNSIDSRYFGLVPIEDIVGKPFLRMWPLKKISLIK